ncbi:MAG TPA: MqnA/MqnD/SBP family protein [Vicinamibacterales bacterium]|nr:MqnA/MqnD/SBP family protein [Vicinamibacterales bacterium]
MTSSPRTAAPARLTIAHSPDADDAFMFYGLASGAVRADGLEIEQVLADIETLNRAALEGRYELTAVSVHAYAYLADRYALLPCGASMGDGYGPIVVARRDRVSAGAPLAGLTVAVPGELTTAFLVLRLFEPRVRWVVRPFDRIQQDVARGEADAGLLIHEGQLTYADDGLVRLVDLGEWWAARTGGLPLPLGANAIRRDLDPTVARTAARLLRDSIAYALEHRAEAIRYARQFGRGLDEGRTDRFVGMYVNALTLDYGARGRAAVRRLFDEAFMAGLLPSRVEVSELAG